MICAISFGDLANATAAAFTIGAALGVIFTLALGVLDAGGRP